MDVEGIESPPGCSGALVFSVESPLPDWGVAADLDGFSGPDGPISPGRVFVKPAFPGAEPVPFVGGVVIATGHGPAPAIGLEMRVGLQPEWVESPGPHEGSFRLVPFVPGGGGMEGDLGTYLGPEKIVTASGQILELTWIASSAEGFHVRADAGSGRFVVEPDLEIVVATNALSWLVRVEGDGFVSDDGEIPLARLAWARLDAQGLPGPWIPLGENGLLLEGTEGRGVHPAAFRFAVDITMGDRAGDYSASLRLVGSGGP
ncbi:MAG: hypothetical protein EHM19_13960 [Candidatus Latescibacterota bacterium]|nr:MAG: hypothetical protein EHM19_13960 [Candidatus Latescibacterota bacterium]